MGITFDLVFVIPTIYFLLIRKSKIPQITTAPIFIAGIVIASFILPNDYQFYLSGVKTWVLPIVETSVFFIIVYKVRQLNKAFKKDITRTLDLYSSLKSAAAEVLPKKISTAFATEIAVIYYGFFSWKKRKLNTHEFSYHKNSGTIGLLIVVIFMILLEMSVVHHLLHKWSIIAAWILSILSFYTSIQIFGFLKSLSKRPISIEDGALKLRYGLFSESTILISNIENVEISSKSNDTAKNLSPLGELEGHNIIISLKNEETLIGLYGLKSSYKTIAFHIDEKEQFVRELNTYR
jgi:hypothetical protein